MGSLFDYGGMVVVRDSKDAILSILKIRNFNLKVKFRK